MDHLVLTYTQYLDAAAPKLETPLRSTVARTSQSNMSRPTVQLSPEVVTDTQLGTMDVKVLRALDVELSTIIKRPVS